MNCPNCDELIEDGAAYCGNCGEPLEVHAPAGKPVGPHIAQVLHSQSADHIPEYAVTKPLQHHGETRAVLSLLLGIVGIIGAAFLALVGLVLGIAGLVLGTMSRNSVQKRFSTLGIVFSSIAIVASLGAWTYVIKKQNTSQQIAIAESSNTVAASTLSTPCYTTGFIDTLNVNNKKNSCDMQAFNGTSIEQSTRAFKVYANQIASVKPEVFNTFAKKAVDKDIATNLPDFNVQSAKYTQFAGSPAYIVNLENSAGVTVTEAVVLRQVQAGANVFVLVYASGNGTGDLSTLEAQWRWK